MITGKLYRDLDVIGEAILLKDLPNSEVLVMVLDLPPPIEEMPFGTPHGSRVAIWKTRIGLAAEANELIYIKN